MGRRTRIFVLVSVAAVLLVPVGSNPVGAAGSDSVSINISGVINYTRSPPATSGDVVVEPATGSTVTSVRGTVTFPGARGGTASATFSLQGLGLTGLHVGSVSISDPGAAVSVSTAHLLVPVNRVPPRGASATASGLSFWPFGSYTLSWSVQDTGTQPPQPPPVPGDPVLVGAGDIALCNNDGDERTAALLDQIPGSVFTLGDNTQHAGGPLDYILCYALSWGRHKSRTRPTAGNHDFQTAAGAFYFGYFGGAAGPAPGGWYSYDVGAWHVIVLNSNCAMVGGCHAGSAQERWLRADLASHPAACTVAMWHHPRFSSGTVGSDSVTAPLWQALDDHGADLVLSGHGHYYERFGPQDAAGRADAGGIRSFVAGTGGALRHTLGPPIANLEVGNDDSYGVLRLTLHARSYDWRFVAASPATFTDAGTASCR